MAVVENEGVSGDLVEIADPLIIRRSEVLDLFDRVLRRELEIGEAILLAIDLVESSKDGTARLEDPGMLRPLEELAQMSAVNLDIIEEVRARLALPHEIGTA